MLLAPLVGIIKRARDCSVNLARVLELTWNYSL